MGRNRSRALEGLDPALRSIRRVPITKSKARTIAPGIAAFRVEGLLCQPVLERTRRPQSSHGCAGPSARRSQGGYT
jgi:hypothetical protein